MFLNGSFAPPHFLGGSLRKKQFLGGAMYNISQFQSIVVVTNVGHRTHFGLSHPVRRHWRGENFHPAPNSSTKFKFLPITVLHNTFSHLRLLTTFYFHGGEASWLRGRPEFRERTPSPATWSRGEHFFGPIPTLVI